MYLGLTVRHFCSGNDGDGCDAPIQSEDTTIKLKVGTLWLCLFAIVLVVKIPDRVPGSAVLVE